jgi:outer membrane protein OmpA-like peptidoglycan-associated protein
MKKSLFLLLGAMCFSNINAQHLAGNKIRDNWSIGINGGVVSPLTHSDFIKNSRAVMGLNINKQLSPVYGLSIESNWTINTQSRMTPYESHTAFDAFDLMLLNRINLNNLFAGYHGKRRFFEVEAVSGFGWLRLMDFHENHEDANHLASKAGMNFNFNLGEKRAWTLTLQPAILWDMSMWDTGSRHSHPNYNANYANWEITAGVTYHFKNSNKKHHMTKVRAYNAEEVAILNAAINELREENIVTQEALIVTQDKLQEEQMKNIALKKALDECINKTPQLQVVTNTQKTLESVVTFRQGKTIIDSSQKPNVERVATYLKNHKNAKVFITGYASPEGSVEINERIANQRAQTVKMMLIEKYRIDAQRITAKGQGVGYMFDEPDWNRVSICTIENQE